MFRKTKLLLSALALSCTLSASAEAFPATVLEYLKMIFDTADKDHATMQRMQPKSQSGQYIAEDFSSKKEVVNVTVPSKVEFSGALGGKYTVTNIATHAFRAPSSRDAFNEYTGADVIYDLMSAVQTVSIPSTITNMGDEVFQNCPSLQAVNIPASVTSLGHSTFDNCPELVYVDFKANLSSGVLPNNTFRGCTSLTEVILPESITSIGAGAFEGCTSLQNVTLKATTLNILASDAFEGIDLLGVTFKVPEGYENNFGKLADAGAIIETDELGPKVGETFTINGVKYETISAHPNEVAVAFPSRIKVNAPFVLPATVEHNNNTYSVVKTASDAFSNSVFTSVTLPEGFRELGTSTFTKCTYMESINFPSTLTTIGPAVFEFIPITSMVIPETVQNIQPGAFQNDTSLVEIDIKANIDYLNKWMFRSCTNLKKVTFPASMTYIGDEVFSNCKKLNEIVFTAKSLTLSDKAFSNQDGSLVDLSNVEIVIPSEADLSGYDCIKDRVKSVKTPDGTIIYGEGAPEAPTGWVLSATGMTADDIAARAGQEVKVIVKTSSRMTSGWFKPAITNDADGSGYFATCDTQFPENQEAFTNDYVYTMVVSADGQSFTFKNCYDLYPPMSCNQNVNHVLASKTDNIADATFFEVHSSIVATSRLHGRYLLRVTNKATSQSFLDLHMTDANDVLNNLIGPMYYETGGAGQTDPWDMGRTSAGCLIYEVAPIYTPLYTVTLKFTGINGEQLTKTITTHRTDANELIALEGNCPDFFTATGVEGNATISEGNTEFTVNGTWNYPFTLNQVFRADSRKSATAQNCAKWTISRDGNDNDNKISTRSLAGNNQNADRDAFIPQNLFYLKGQGYNNDHRLIVTLHSLAFADNQGLNFANTSGGTQGKITNAPTEFIVKTSTESTAEEPGFALQPASNAACHLNDISSNNNNGYLGIYNAASASQNDLGSFIRVFGLTESDYATTIIERDGSYYRINAADMAAARENPTSENVRAVFDNATEAPDVTLTVNLTHNGRIVKTETITAGIGSQQTVSIPDFFADEPFTVTMPAADGTIDHALTQLALPFQHTETTDNMIWQAVHIHYSQRNSVHTGSGMIRLTWTFQESDDNNLVQSEPADVTTNGYADTQLWAFVGNIVDGFKIYNKEAGLGQWLYTDGDAAKVGTTETKSIWKPYITNNTTARPSDTYCCFKAEGTGYINVKLGQQARYHYLSHYGTADEGSTCWFEAPSEQMLTTAGAFLLEDYVGPENAVGAINYGNIDNVAARTLIELATADKYNLDYADQLRTLIAGYDENVSIKALVPNGYYRIQAILSGDMIYTASFDDNGQVDNGLRLTGYEGDAHRQDYHTIFKFEPVAGQTERYHLLSQGLYVGQATGQAQPIMQVEADGDRGEYSLAHSNHDSDPTINSSAAWILRDDTYTNTDNKNFFHQSQGTSHIQAYGQYAHGSHFYILEAEHIDVNLVANADTMKIGFGYFPFPVYATDAQTKLYHLHASTDKATNEPVITFKQVDAIEANTAFMVSHSNVDSEKVTLAIGTKAPVQVRRRAESDTEADDEADETNLLGGHLRQTQVEAGNYVFGTLSDNQLGFRKLDDATAVAGNFAYIPAANLSAAQAANAELPLVDRSNTTGISELSAQGQARQVIYDLQGRRLSKPAKGFNIINGVKTYVR